MTQEQEDKMIGESIAKALDTIADNLTCGKAELSVVYVKDEEGNITAQAKTKGMISLAVMRDPSLLPTDILKLAGGHPLNTNVASPAVEELVRELNPVLHERCLFVDAWRKVEKAKEILAKYDNAKGR